MTRKEIALKFLNSFYNEWNAEHLKNLLADDLKFDGPFYTFNSSEDYVNALIADPPVGMQYTLTDIFENEDSVCVIYGFSKGNINCAMCQVFTFNKNNRICNIRLIFDTGKFKS